MNFFMDDPFRSFAARTEPASYGIDAALNVIPHFTVVGRAPEAAGNVADVFPG
jgi:hypothetical protein